LNASLITAIFEDSQGRLWVGGSSGLHLMARENSSFTRYQHDPNDRYSLSSGTVLAIHEDRSGVIWFGTTGGGLSKYIQANERFALYQRRPGAQNSLSDDVVNALYEDRQSSVWVGTMDGGLNQLDLQNGTVTVYENNPSDSSSLGNNDVRAVYEDQEGTLWVGTYGAGINRFDRAARRFTRFHYDQHDPRSLSDDRVMAIYEDRRGNLWVGTRSGGLNLMTNRQVGQFIHFQHDPDNPASLSGDFVRVIYEDSHGKLWIGTYTGISVLDLDTKRFTHYHNDPNDANSLSNDRVLSFYESADGVMWVGTLMGGLNRFDRATQTFQHYTEKQGLPNDAVHGILGDAQGNLWLSTNLGLSRFNPASASFHNYDIRDGLQSNEFNAGAYFQRSQNRLYFGGVQGITVFDPADVVDNPTVPPVVITAFKKFNQVERTDLEASEDITLSYQDNFISFEFAALDFSTPEKNQYAYMLEGFNKDWVYSGTLRNASYTNLKGGEYTFRVKGSNKDGVWNESGTAVSIVVVPPLWERWWFIGSLALGIVGSIAGGYLLRIRRIQFEQRILEEQVLERTQEIERRRQVAEGLREILAILNSNRTLRESLDWIIQQAVRLTGARAMVIFRNSEGSLPVAVASNLPQPASSQLVEDDSLPAAEDSLTAYTSGDAPVNAALARRMVVMYMPDWISKRLMTGHPLVVSDMNGYRQAHPELNGHRLEQFGALLAVPLWMNDLVDGGLVLLYDRAYSFSNEDLETAQNFADHAALAIANARLRVQAEQQAVSAERSRLARDLHDAVTQTLFATSLIAEVLPRLWERSPELGKQKVAEIRELTRGALAEMRTLLMELRPAALEDVALADLLQQLSEGFTGRARVPVSLQADKTIQLPPNVKMCYYRIAQEALNNISKHARANQVTIQLSEGPQGVLMQIQDDGIGFVPEKGSPDHFGLGIMEERALAIGACYQIESQPGAGTLIRVNWETD
jgi:signal transduction histidine kinase/streptogramin lyase